MNASHFVRQLQRLRFATGKPRLNRVQGFPDSLRLGFPLLAEKEKGFFTSDNDFR
jgi:hypothetical protein